MQKFIKFIIALNIVTVLCANAQQFPNLNFQENNAYFMTGQNNHKLPSLGNYSSNVLTRAEEKKLGQLFMKQLRQQIDILYDPLINDYINSIGQRLATSSADRRSRFHFFVVNDPAINAFAGPDGHIGVNTGTILTTTTESELAAVMSHEITHINQRHIARAIARQRRLSLPTIAGILAAVAIGTQNPEVGIGAVTAIMAGSAQSYIDFTRENEKEADRIGMQTLYNAGFDPMAMPEFFERMQKANINYMTKTPEYLQNHPITTVRIADAVNRAKQYPQKKIESSMDYYLMRARIRVINDQTGNKAAIFFHDCLRDKTCQNMPAAEYGYALALLKQRKFTKADTVITKLIKQDPNQVIYQMAQAQIKMKSKQQTAALKILKNSLELYPDYYPLIIQYGHALLKNGDFKTARIFLKQQVENYPDDKELWSILAKAQGETGQLADAYQSRAKLFELDGNKRMAIVQLKQALKLKNLDKDTKEILKAKIKRLEQ